MKEESFPPALLYKEERKEEEMDVCVLSRTRRKSRKKEMVIPTLEEVDAYIKSIEITSFTAEDFFDYYSARGWRMNDNNPMSDWQACIRS